MKTIRYWTTHPNGKDNPGWMEVFELDPTKFEFVYDDSNPECLVATEQLFTDPAAMKDFARLYDPRRLLLCYAGECYFPDMNIFDYAVAFDRHFTLSDRVIRRPTLSFFQLSVFGPLDVGCMDADAELKRKTGFCDFIYSNPIAHPRRDQLFRLLSSYRRVDSLGQHLNNCGNEPSRESKDWRRQSVELKSAYKFSIACENAVYPGYVSEKLLSSYQAHAVPIYFGDPTVLEEFNSKAIINANGLTDAEVLEIVRRIDGDDMLWKAMISEPLLTPKQAKMALSEDENYRAFWNRIFSMEIADAKRVPVGTWPTWYVHNWVARAVYCQSAYKRAKHASRRRERMAAFASILRRIVELSKK